MRRFAWLLMLVVFLTGCQLPSLLARPPVGGGAPAGVVGAAVPALQGKVELEAFGYGTQATVPEIARAATVSLIRADTNETVGSTVTDANGGFVLTFGNAFRPQTGLVYYLEAVKGLGQNRAGISVARLRTMIRWEGTGWTSLTNVTPGEGLTIARSTTAISTITSLRQTVGNPVDPVALIGSLRIGQLDSNGFDTFVPGTSGIPGADYAAVMALVTDAITRDQDPLGVIIYDTVNYTFQRVTSGFTVSGLSPAAGPIGTTVTISGTNLDPDPSKNLVRFNGIQGQVTAATSTALTVVVPAGATTGPVSVQIGGLVLAGISYTVTSSDGHNLFDPQGNLYVGSLASNAIYRISPSGVLTRFATSTSINSPQGLTYFNGSLYVASYNNSLILKIDQNGTVTTLTSAVSQPRSIIVDPQGTLYVASSNTLYRLSQTGVPTQVATGFSNIRGLAYNNGRLYLSESGANQVRRIEPDNSVTTYVTGLSSPSGLSFDTAGNLYVANQGDNSLVKFDANTLMTLFASVSNPEGLAFNANGTFYTTNQNTNTIYQVTLSGAVRSYAVGLNDPTGLTVDANGDFYLANRGTSSLARVPAGGFLSSVMSGFSRPMDVVRVADGTTYVANYNSGSIARVGTDGSVSTLANIAYPAAMAHDPATNRLGVVSWSGYYDFYTINLGTGAVARYLNPLPGYANKLLMADNGDLYGTIDGAPRIFRIASGSVEMTPQVNATDFTSTPWGLCWEPTGTLLVTLPGQNKVVRLDPATGTTSDVITTGLNSPYGIVRDADGTIYIANYGGQSIVKYASGTLTTVWSNDGTTGSPLNPQDLAITNGKLYILNYGYNNLLEYNLSTAAKGIAIPTGGTIGFGNLYTGGLSVNPTDGTLYAKYYKNGSGYRVAVLTTGGQLTDIPSSGYRAVAYYQGKLYTASYLTIYQDTAATGASCGAYATGYYQPQGVVFAADGHPVFSSANGQVLKTNLTTGRTTVIGWLPNNSTSWLYDVARNPVTGEIFASDWNYVYKVPATPGPMTSYGAYNNAITSIAFSPTGALYALNNNSYNTLRQYSTTTNTWTTVETWCNQPRF